MAGTRENGRFSGVFLEVIDESGILTDASWKKKIATVTGKYVAFAGKLAN